MLQQAHVNSALLIWARDSINMELDEAARKLQIKPERLQEFESGQRKPTVGQARNMARVYRRPLACFYLPKPPEDLGFRVPHDFRRLPEAKRGKFSSELIAELRRIEYLREMVVELAEDIPNTPSQFVASATVKDRPDAVAERATELLGIDMRVRSTWRDRNHYDALNGWRQSIENIGVLVFHLKRVDEQEIRGIAIAEKKFPVIAINGKSVNGRIFSLIHEFAHLLLGASGMSDMRPIHRVQTADERVEQFCNQVAAEVLVPQKSLLAEEMLQGTRGRTEWTDDQLEELSHRYSVSREVIARRLFTLGRTTQELYQRKRQQYKDEAAASSSSGFVTPPIDVIRSLGKPLTQIVLNAYQREAISASELADVLGARLKHLPKIRSLLRYPSMDVGAEH